MADTATREARREDGVQRRGDAGPRAGEVIHPAAARMMRCILPGVLALTCAAAVHAQPAWPSRPIRLVSPLTPGGHKGMGEGGTIGAPAAIANAVADAVKPLGIAVTSLPILPETLLRRMPPA